MKVAPPGSPRERSPDTDALKNDSYKDDLNVYNRVAVETFKESSNLQFYSYSV